jgi:serine/threonine protein kinase
MQRIRLSAGVGTPHYTAPEQSGTEYDQKVDVFPLGLILLELSMKFGTYHERIVALRGLKQAPRQFPDDFPPHFTHEAQLALWLSEGESEARPTAADVLESDLLKGWKAEVGLVQDN